MTASTRLAAALFALALPALSADDPAQRPDGRADGPPATADDTSARTNVALTAAAVTGSLAPQGAEALLRGNGDISAVTIPPHDLVITWDAPVTFDAHDLQWGDAPFCGRHFGLEA